MTVSLNGNDISQAIEIAIAVGGILAMLIAGLVFYLLVRPPRRAKIPTQPPRSDALDPEEVMQLLDRMEERLGVLERAVGRDGEPRRIAAHQDDLIATGVERPDMRRK